MRKTFFKKITLLLLAIVLIFGAVVFISEPAFSAAKDDVCEGIGLASGTAGCEEQGGLNVRSVVVSAINILSFIVGIAAVVMIIIGGLKFVMSGGDSNNTNTARNTILYALVGLVVAALAQILVRFVLNRIG